MHGLGNDFMVIDASQQTVALPADIIKQLSDRHFGIGFDQLLLVERSENADFKYRIFNADGNEVEQCGNGARCFAQFVREQGLCSKDNISVEVADGVNELQIEANGDVTVTMGRPQIISLHTSININSQQYDATHLSIGNPHLVLFIKKVDTMPINKTGRELQDKHQNTNGINVGFVEIIDRKHIRLRVYERGVGETLACGSGACAAVAAGIMRDMLDRTVTAELKGGSLEITWQGNDASILMTGPAVTVFEGTIKL